MPLASKRAYRSRFDADGLIRRPLPSPNTNGFSGPSVAGMRARSAGRAQTRAGRSRQHNEDVVPSPSDRGIPSPASAQGGIPPAGRADADPSHGLDQAFGARSATCTTTPRCARTGPWAAVRAARRRSRGAASGEHDLSLLQVGDSALEVFVQKEPFAEVFKFLRGGLLKVVASTEYRLEWILDDYIPVGDDAGKFVALSVFEIDDDEPGHVLFVVFMHYTYHILGGTFLVTDMQGIVQPDLLDVIRIFDTNCYSGSGNGNGPPAPPPPPPPGSDPTPPGGGDSDDSAAEGLADSDSDGDNDEDNLRACCKLVSQMKIKHPCVYNGLADVDIFDHWCYEVDLWKRMNGVHTKWVISLMSGFLGDKALRLFTNNVVLSKETWTMHKF
ncbi:hypothetical protein AURDEDRAFT_163538 [Auricularia subglabra TFB-10046 SS5]|nr:hypothetical protein AURDEDRAFT_163538 [Auricularia subglabra TFB-10046 SS5]